MIDYVKKHLRTKLNVEPPVHAISVIGGDAALCDRWFDEELQPMLARHRELTALSHKCKAGALREAVTAALQRRLQAASETGVIPSEPDPNQTVEALRGGERVLERAQGQAFFITQKISKMRLEIVKAAAKKIAIALHETADVDPSPIFAETLKRMLAEPVAAVLQAVEETRDALSHAMQLAAPASGAGVPDELPRPAGMPALDVSELPKKIDIQKPAIISMLGKKVLVSHVHRKLEDEYDRALLELLSFYANRLRRWMQQSIETLRSAFAAAADMHRAQFKAAQFDGSLDADVIRNDLRILRDWSTAHYESASVK